MRTRVFRRILLSCSIVFFLLPLVTQAAAPNFVVILADDLGANDLGTYGHPVIKTPNIDQLARQGLQFNNAFLATSSCSASRASLLTGRYPHSTGAPKLDDVLPAEQRLVSSYLREAGYYTAVVGKWHNGGKTTAQFDLVVDPPGDSGAEGWIDTLRNRPKDKPFFFWFASRDPHVPYSALQKDGPYQPKDAVTLPTMFDGPGARQNIAQYYTEISRLDSYVGKVVEELKAQGLLDNTYIVFISDNGAPMPRAKTTLYDTGIKTPLLISGPQIVAGTKSDQLVSGIDVIPTVLTLAGIKNARTVQGQSLLAFADKMTVQGRDYVYAEQHDHGFALNKRAVRNQDYLYIHNFGRNDNSCLLEVQPMGKELVQAFRDKKLDAAQSLCFARQAPSEELYDVRKDRLNLTNLAAEPALAAIKQQMAKKLDEQATATGDAVYLLEKNVVPFKGKRDESKK